MHTRRCLWKKYQTDHYRQLNNNDEPTWKVWENYIFIWEIVDHKYTANTTDPSIFTDSGKSLKIVYVDSF